MNTSYAKATVRELHTSDVEAPFPAAACCHPQQVSAEGVGNGASARPSTARPFDNFLSERLDWLTTTIEKEIDRPSAHSAARLRLLRAMKATLEGEI